MAPSNKIENPKTSVSGKSNFDDEDILNTALSTEKNICNTYMAAMQEASNEQLSTLIMDMFKDTSRQHRKLLDLQFQHGWRSLTPAPVGEITALEKEYTDAVNQLK